MTDERKEYLRRCWENEVTAEDEEWRDDLTDEEQKMVDCWDGGYAEGIARMAGDILEKGEAAMMDERLESALKGVKLTEQEKRYLEWLSRMDGETVEVFAGLFEKIKKPGDC